MRDRHLQCPHDAFHCMGGLANEMLQSTFEILFSKGETEFLKVWHDFEFPPYWSQQQNPITHLGSYFFSDYLHLSIIMPFLINRVLHITMLNKTFVEYVIETCTITKSQVLDKLLGLWVYFSWMVSLTFHKEFSDVDYNNLQQSIILWSRLVAKVIENLILIVWLVCSGQFNLFFRFFPILVDYRIFIYYAILLCMHGILRL